MFTVFVKLSTCELFERAAFRLLLSGTLERADGKAILWLPDTPDRIRSIAAAP